jgi:hypothetical protein
MAISKFALCNPILRAQGLIHHPYLGGVEEQLFVVVTVRLWDVRVNVWQVQFTLLMTTAKPHTQAETDTIYLPFYIN